MYILKLSYKGSDGIFHEGNFFSGFGTAYRSEYEIFEPVLETAVNSVGHFSFTVYPTHPLYEFADQPKAVLEVVRYGITEPLFIGRLAECSTGLYNEKILTFESELSYLLDSVRTNFNSEAGYGCEYWLNDILEYHNNHAGNFGSVYTENIQRKFTCGKVSESIKIRCTDIPYEEFKGTFSTLEIIRKLLLEKYGGVLKIRHVGGVNYVDWLDENDLHVCSQKIELAKNLLNIENSVTTDEIVTAIRPIGENVTQGSESAPLNIALTDVSGYISDEDIFQVTDDTVSALSSLRFTDTLYSRTLVNRYGWICREVYFPGVTHKTDLTKKAVNYLQSAGQKQSIILNAVDLFETGNSIENFLAGDMAVVNSPVHSFCDRKMLITSVMLNLSDPSAGEIVLGNETESITSQVGSGAVSASGGGFSRGGSGESVDIDEAVKTALEEAKKYTDNALENKVDKEAGKTLSTNDFTDEYKAQTDKNTTDIEDLKSHAEAVDVNISNLSHEVKNKANSSDVYTKSQTDTKLSQVSRSVTELSGQVTQNSSDITALEKKVEDISSSGADLNDYYNKAQVDEKISDVGKDITGLDIRLTQTEDKVFKQGQYIAENTENIEANSNGITGLDIRLTQAEDKVFKQGQFISENTSNIEKNTTDIGGLKSECTRLLSNVTALTQLVTDIEADVETNTSGITNLRSECSRLLSNVTALINLTNELEEKITWNEITLGYRNKNLFCNTAKTQTINGVTFTVNSDGSVTANGKATANAILKIAVTLKKNTSYILSGISNPSASTYTISLFNTANWNSITALHTNPNFSIGSSDIKAELRCVIYNGYTANNVVFYPMIRYSYVTDNTYEQGFGDVNTRLNNMLTRIEALEN